MTPDASQMYIAGETFDDILRLVLERLLKIKDRVKASRGENAELVGVLLCLKNPRARLSKTERKGKIFSAIGELLWYLSKRDDLEFIEYFIPGYGKDNSDDGQTVWGAYGPRLFAMRGTDQIQNVLKLLANGGTSRRALIQLFNAEDIIGRRAEIPCTCTLQFLSRHGRLDLIVTMRSNDAYKGLSHDIFAFTMLQEIIARKLGLDLGIYRHFVGSLHLYDEDREKAKELINEGWQPIIGAAMHPMPVGDPDEGIRAILSAEASVRTRQNLNPSLGDLDPYWADIVRLIQIFRLSKDDKPHEIAAIKKQMHYKGYDSYIQGRQRRQRTLPASGQLTIAYPRQGRKPKKRKIK